MQSNAAVGGAPGQTAPTSTAMLWTGRILTALPVALMLFSGGSKLAKAAAVVEGFGHFGYPESVIIPIGIVEIACAVLFLIPRTSVLGAILLTGYLGGATATHVRVGEVFIIPVLLGVAAWAALFAREPRLRSLIPLRK